MKVHEVIEKNMSVDKKFYMIGGIRMSEELMENDAFVNGVAVGVNLYQERVITAHRRNEPLIIGDNLYYLQSGRERLAEVLNKICK